MKEHNLSKEFNSMMKKLTRKKDERIHEFEELKKKVLFKIDSHLDRLYKKRDYIAEVLANKKEFRKLRLGVWKKFIRTSFWNNLKAFTSMPFIYMIIIPTVIMHAFIQVYQQICFRIYGIPRVNSKEYFIFDRGLLPQLNWFEKFNCVYCSYFTCLISFTQEIGARTERFWCPIKHARRMANPHSQYNHFSEYSDGKNLRSNWKDLRKFKEFK